MNAYQPRSRRTLHAVRGAARPGPLAQLPAFAEADPDLMRQVLDEAGKFVGEVVAPLQPRRRRDRRPLRRPAPSPCRRVFATPTRPSGRPAGRRWPARAGRRRPGPARGAGGGAVRVAERRQPRLDHGAGPAARRLRMHQAPRQRRAEGALPGEDRQRRMAGHHVPDRAPRRQRPGPGAHQRRAAGRRQLPRSAAPRSSSPAASTT